MIQQRIEALLRLAQSDNEAEATLALERATQLAIKHQINLATIDPHRRQETSQIITETIKPNYPGIPKVFMYNSTCLYSTICENISVYPLITRSTNYLTWTLVGTQTDINLTKAYLATIIPSAYKQYRQALRAGKIQPGRTSSIRSYLDSMAIRLNERLQQARHTITKPGSSTDLVLRDKLTQAQNTWHTANPNTLPMRHTHFTIDQQAAYTGYKHANNLDINAGSIHD
jgi:hypothetical protein